MTAGEHRLRVACRLYLRAACKLARVAEALPGSRKQRTAGLRAAQARHALAAAWSAGRPGDVRRIMNEEFARPGR